MKKTTLVIYAVVIIVMVIFIGRMYISDADFSLENPYWNGLSGINTADARPLYDLSSLSGAGASDTLLIVSPASDYTVSESGQVASFLARGGKVVVMDDFGHSGSLLSSLGSSIALEQVPLCEYESDHVNHSFPIVTKFSQSAETENVSQLIFNHPASLSVSGNAYPLALTTDYAWPDVNDNSRLDGNERMGTYCVAARESYGGGELMVISDPDLLINGMIDMGDNKVFMSNVLTGTVWVDIAHGSGVTPAGALYYVIKYDLRAQLVIVLVSLAAGLAFVKRRTIAGWIGKRPGNE